MGAALPEREWRMVKQQTIFDCCKWDVQSEDHCVLASFPLILPEKEWQFLKWCVNDLSTEALAAECEILSRPDLHKRLGIPGRIRKCLENRGESNLYHSISPRVMRFDFHYTEDGWRLSEVNADVPGGFNEASGFTRLMAPFYPQAVGPPDPTEAYAEAIFKRVGSGALVGMIHATAHSDDRQVMEFVGQYLRARGMKTCMLSPAHLRWNAGRAYIACNFAHGEPNLLVRFYPAEWLPNLGEESIWSGFFLNSQNLMSNPCSSLLIQTKRFPVVWNQLRTELGTWKAWLPETRCPLDVPDLWSGEWVLKPALGRMGEGIGIPGTTGPGDLKEIASDVAGGPENWAAQKRFRIVPLTAGGNLFYPCVGVYSVDGNAAGMYGRIARKPMIDHEAQDAAVLIG
jgi:glutathionylspermidine synthase